MMVHIRALGAVLMLAACLAASPGAAETPAAPPSHAWGADQPIITFEDALLAFNPSEDNTPRVHPRESMPKDAYFRWRGRISAVQGTQGPHTERQDPFRGIRHLTGWSFTVFLCLDSQAPFAFRDIRKAYGELEEGREVDVIGRYVGLINVEMSSGEFLTIPLLDNCYVR